MADQPVPSPPVTLTIVPSPPPRPPRRWSHLRTALVTVLLCAGVGYLLVKYHLPTREWYVGEGGFPGSSSLNGDADFIKRYGATGRATKEEYLFTILGSKVPPGGKVRLFNEAVHYSNSDSDFLTDPLVRGYLLLLVDILLSAEPDTRDGQLDALRLLNRIAIAGSKWIDSSDVKDDWQERNPFALALRPFLEFDQSTPPDVRRFLTSTSVEIRAAVLDLYLRRGWSPPQECLLPVLRDPAPSVRKRAFAATRYLSPLEIQDELIRGIDDPDPEVARLAVRSLGASLSGESRRLAADVHPAVADRVRAALIGVLFTQAELDAIPAEVRAKSRWRSPDPISIPGERQPAKLRAQAVLSLGQMPCTPESVAAILRSLADPHEEVVSAAAVAILSPSFTTDEPMWAKIADTLLRAMRDKVARDPREPEPNEYVFSVEPLQTILRTLATRSELHRHARDAVPELLKYRPWICGRPTDQSAPRYQPDVASPSTRHLPRQPFPRFRYDVPHQNTLQLTRYPEWAGGVWVFSGLFFTSLMDRIGRANESDLPALEKLLTVGTEEMDAHHEVARAIVRTLATADKGPNRFDHIRGPKYHPLVVEMAEKYEWWASQPDRTE